MAMRIISSLSFQQGPAGFADFQPYELGVLNATFVKNQKAAIGRYIERLLVAGIKRKSHGRRREFREWGCCACRRIVAIDAIVRIDGDEYRALCVNGEVLQERGRAPRRDSSSKDWSELSPIVFWIVVCCRCDHLISPLTG